MGSKEKGVNSALQQDAPIRDAGIPKSFFYYSDLKTQ